MTTNKYFVFTQNNANGCWIEDRWVGKRVIVEAHCADLANYIVEGAGMDFEDNCNCCGYRWHRQDDQDAMNADQVDAYVLDWIKHYRTDATSLRVYPEGYDLPLCFNGVLEIDTYFANDNVETMPL